MTAREWLKRRPLLCRWLPVVAWMGLIFFLSAQPDLPKPDIGWVDLVIGNGAHLFLYGVLAVLWARALGERREVRLLAFGLTLLYALSDEFHQAFVPGRHPDPLDLVCDALGAVLGLWGWAWFRHRSVGSPGGRLDDRS